MSMDALSARATPLTSLSSSLALFLSLSMSMAMYLSQMFGREDIDKMIKEGKYDL